MKAKRKKSLNKIFSVFLTLMFLISGFFYSFNNTNATIYTFTQTDWSGGVSTSTAIHPTNQAGWTKYDSKDTYLSVVNAGADLQLGLAPASNVFTSDTDFNSGTFTNATTTGTGASSSIILTKAENANAWSAMTSAPAAVSGGAALTYDNNGNIYALRGGTNISADFWKYNIASSTWTTLPTTPLYVGGFGAALTYDNNGNIYAFSGGLNTDFWKYNIASSTWTTMTSAPAGVSDGGSLTYDNNGNIYAVKGDNSIAFWKYNIASSTWTTMTSLPAGVFDGGSLTYDNNGNIYAFRGTGSTLFYKYNIASSTWTSMTAAPDLVDAGGSLTYDNNGNIYGFRGNNTTNFWKYNIASSTWTVMTSAPAVVNAGGSLIYDNNGNIYGFGGGGGTNFWKYNIYNNYNSSGVFESATVDLGAPKNLTTLGFTASGTVQIQLATAATAGGPWNYVGPDGTSGTYFTTSGSSTPAVLNGNQYLRYKITLAGAGGGWSSLANTPAAISDGGALAYDKNGGFYAFGGDSNNTGFGSYNFWKYSVTANTWSTKPDPPQIIYLGGALTYDSNSNIFGYAGGNTLKFMKYNITSNSWVFLSDTPANPGYPGMASDNKGNIFVFRGSGGSAANANLWKYNIASSSWQTMANAPSASLYGGNILVFGDKGLFYALRANNTSDFWKYDTGLNSWTTLQTTPANTINGASLAKDGSGNIYALGGGATNYFWKYDVQNNTWSSLTNTPSPVSYGGSIAYDYNGNFYVFRGNVTNNFWKYSLKNPSTSQLDDLTINYSSSAYVSSATLTSSPYNSATSTNYLKSVLWTQTAPTGTQAKFQLRTAPDSAGSPGTWSSWLGPDGSTSTYFTNATGADNIPTIFKDGLNDQWFQYKAYLTSSGASTPTLSDVSINYKVNVAPNFDPNYPTVSAGGVSASQNTSSTDPNWGKIAIQYSVRDSDTETGTITPSFEYNTGSGWQAIASQYLVASDTSVKAVSSTSYSSYTAVWDAKSQIPGIYSVSASIRVSANDGEPVNNIGQATSVNFVLDTKTPAVTAFKIDAVNNILTINISDDTNLNYRLSNNSGLSSDGLNASSGQWQNVSSTSLNTTSTWVLTGAPSYQTVYLQIRDNYGNSTTTLATAPSTPSSMDIKDISNVSIGVYRQFISWGVYQPTSTALFASYKLYRSTDGSVYNLFNTITDINLNYYIDTAVSSSTTYYYKVIITDTDNETSPYSAVVSHKPSGFGGTDITPPTISSVVVAQTQSTWARITWTTDKLSDTEVNFSANSPSFLVAQSVNTMVTSHSIVVNGLSPNTLYYFRAKSKDILNNQGMNDNNGSGYQFTTIGGPIISNVTAIPGDRSATIVWNTNTDSGSYVDYSVSPTLSGATEVGSAALVGGVSSSTYQHRVSLTNLNPGVTYYYYVKSTDVASNTSIDNNNGVYYSFNTTYDTKPPAITGVDTPVLTSSAAVIVWSTDEPATTQAYYRTASSTYAYTTLDSTLTRSHVVSLTGLTSEKTYTYYAESKDEAQNRATSSELTFITTAPGEIRYVAIGGGGGSVATDTTPPKISNIQTSFITAFGATITFDTDEPATAFVLYGKDQQYGATAGSYKLGTSQSITLSGLRLGTAYHFAVKAQDKAGNFSTSDDQTFTTKYIAESSEQLKQIENAAQFEKEIENSIETILPSLLPPFIEEPKVENITENSAKITWKTNVNSFSVVSYAGESDYNASTTNPYTLESSDVVNKTTQHEINLSGLKPNTKYHYKVKSFRIPDVVGTSNDLTFITKAAKVQAIITDIKNNSFSVTWTTDEPASSIVEYKNLLTGETFRKTEEEMRNSHSMLVDNLTPATKYEVGISGYNTNGNLIEGGEKLSVITSRDVTPPIISGFKVDNALVPGRNDRIQTIISWKTDEPANSAVYYNEGSAPNSEFQNKLENLNSYITDHTVILSNFKPATIYQIKIISDDQSGNKATFGPRTIITPAQSESIFNVIFKNFEDTFKFMRNVGQ